MGYRYLRFDRVETDFFPGSLEIKTLCWVLLSRGKKKSPKLHQRARVLGKCEEENRVLVQFSKGSPYRVRRSNLIPVLEHQENLILVASETTDYRKTAVVHTHGKDHFLEIGCDFGVLVDRIEAKSRLGIDKSEESIRIAKNRYPTLDFLHGDIFKNLKVVTSHPLVVAIDINGNRELTAVPNCLQLVLDSWSPRLVIVKSRELFV